MSHFPITRWLPLAALLSFGCAFAASAATAPAATPVAAGSVAAAPAAPSWQADYGFGELGKRSDMLLLGIRNTEQIEFRLRRDRIARSAVLDLSYTPSPALLPTLSHLRVYLNDQLMGVLPIAKEDLGQRVRRQLPLDARLLTDFNRVRLEFVGHYDSTCEDMANSTLWVNIGHDSAIRLAGEALAIQDDLANFPLPFFDPRDPAKLELPVVFAGSPSVGSQRAAAIAASYFGSQAGWWRQAHFPVRFGDLPASGNAVVFATNDRRPAFLAAHPAVDGPVVELADRPGAEHGKLLLVLGRNDADLELAASALAAGSTLFRGRQVKIDQLQPLAPRKPYDAPNWTRTDRPVRLVELLDYPQQMQIGGLFPRPITVNLNLPPDLFVWRNQGIPLRLLYRYTPPPGDDESRLTVSVNDQFIASLPLVGGPHRGKLEQLRLPVLSGDAGASDKLLIPALKIGDHNQLRFDFSFASVVGSAQRDVCRTTLPVNVQGAVEDDSTIDFSGFQHYIGLPDLAAFALSGFPFSRMADLSETVALVPANASREQVGTLLDLVGGLGAQTGYPALGLRVTDDWKQAAASDADLLLIGTLPAELRERADPALLLENQRSVLRQAGGRPPAEAALDARLQTTGDGAPVNRVAVSSSAPLAAILGMQSPFHPQRSIVALEGNQPADYALLQDTLGDIGKRAAVAGSVALIRSSGVSSQFVGEHYYVGNLPWWLLLWFHLSGHPLLLAALATLAVVLAAFLLWLALRRVAARRVAQGD
ncbi:cellulose biosynthesis cyclic di-GMP-binding regulatory protein BcsB [Frateuria defendens]|uniref:cellulose biosynthesis cyclic di-GMP-binding regulatory protein BcsB n=1 Tax=Frateuria defendens TaxID=2219559 RepID=UPI00066FD161|nr:cellulose biosynthesis cyclic di-GMP-binding regulatory protein BcsB [Frateuria defendens]